MPLFQTAIPIKSEEIQKLLKSHWNLKLGKLIKASQNHTFQAFSEDGSKKYSVRVTPDPEKKCLQRIDDQLFFVSYLVKNGLHHICSPVPNLSEKIFLVEGDLIMAVFEWARGSPLGFVQFRWMRDISVIKAWGRFFAQMHKLSKKFSIQFPAYVQRIQKWDEVHCGTLKGTKIHPEDLAVMNDPEHYGVIHGDLNTSNIFYVDEGDYLSAYDTDQVQVGFYLFDIAQACITVVMVEDGGMPISGTPIQGANKKQFIGHMIEGYESEGLKVDRQRLDRMIEIKKQLYVKFAIQAEKEGNTPPDMAPFLKYIRECLQPKWKLQI